MIELRRAKPRLHRVEKPATPSLAKTLLSSSGEEGNQIWMVSYADLLMILLCFFVLFFSISPETRESVIHKILLTEATKDTPFVKVASAASGESNNVNRIDAPAVKQNE